MLDQSDHTRLLMRRFQVADDSMSPSLKAGKRVVGVKLRRPRRGVVVFFRHPAHADLWLVKRIVGLPGEKIEIAAGDLMIDGRPMSEPWTIEPTTPDGSWVVPPGEVFVLSDARHRTAADSRSFGPVSIASMYRRAWPVPWSGEAEG
jgi:signal peptidase I